MKIKLKITLLWFFSPHVNVFIAFIPRVTACLQLITWLLIETLTTKELTRRISTQKVYLWWRTCVLATIVFSILSREVCVHVSQLAATGTVECNKSQRKLASSRRTLIHSILLSLCALFSPSPNAETLNLHTQIHQGPRVRMDALWDVRGKTHAGESTHR